MPVTLADLGAYRMAYDLDDTSVRLLNLTQITTTMVPLQYLRMMNDEYWTIGGGWRMRSQQSGWISLLFMFKQPVDIRGYCFFGDFSGVSGASIEFNPWDKKTSDGFNGTWENAIGIENSDLTKINQLYRIEINDTPYNSARAIRFNFRMNSSSSYIDFGALHLYGTPNINANRQLAICDEWGQEADPLYFDFESISANSQGYKAFTVRNLSDSNATGIRITLDVPTEQAPPILSQYSISTSSSTPGVPQIYLVNNLNEYDVLAPGQESRILYLIQRTSSAPAPEPFCGRIVTEAKFF